ncbi:hypothetical protein CBR_g51129 [Chara braunii]|uniref:Glycosyltransferase 2-like domain-containing protein n=1 Tax=Chara braunii TaxID=69332 RepID=A0A388M850_CHABU|nr:hypothetical protein CBR_g51129 [Chara braunii]|eukprot:GBG90685.1 hypothetical protein CBR_g51129 [Chara braunii]
MWKLWKLAGHGFNHVEPGWPCKPGTEGGGGGLADVTIPILQPYAHEETGESGEDGVVPTGPRTTLGDYQDWLLVGICFCLSLLASSVYVGWKLSVFARLWRSATTYSLFFLAIELLLYLSQLSWAAEFSRPPASRKRLRLGSNGPFPRVAILTTCCNEEFDVVQDTVLCALRQDYPQDRYGVWVLDDGKDDELKAWIETLAKETGRQVGYIRRPKQKGVPHHFKAGNLNYAVSQLQDEFIAVLDADMIVSSDFLSGMLPHFFSSPKIAFVQAPQAYYNISRGDPLNGSNIYFYDVCLPQRDAFRVAQCVGTGVIFRRSSLSAVGLFVTGAVTEDIGTSLQLHSQGWESVYVNERFQMGLTPWTFDRYAKQQFRWCMGELQVIWQRGLIWAKGDAFSLSRRLIYFQAGLHSFLAFSTLGLIVLAQVLCIFQPWLLPLEADQQDYRNLVLFITPHLVFGRLGSHAIHLRVPGFMSRQQVRIRGEQAWYWMAPYKCLSVLRAYIPWVSKTFEATGSKSTDDYTGPFALVFAILKSCQLIGFHLLYVVIALAGIGWRITLTDLNSCHDLMSSTLVILWMLFNAQQMCPPILFQLFPPAFPVETDRRSLLRYDEHGVPVYEHERGMPPTDWRVIGLEILPTVQAVVWMYLFWIAFHPDYKPGYCQGDFFQHKKEGGKRGTRGQRSIRIGGRDQTVLGGRDRMVEQEIEIYRYTDWRKGRGQGCREEERRSGAG